MIRLKRQSTNIGHTDDVVLYPTYAVQHANRDSWRVPIWGTVYETERASIRKRMLVRLLKRVMKVDPACFQSDLFRQRIRHFVAATERAKRVWVQIGEQLFRLRRRSRRNGNFRGVLTLSNEQVDRLAEQGVIRDGWLHFEVLSRGNDNRRFQGQVQLIESTGVSVISDIDDTMKTTQVHDLQSMLENTFLEEFQPVDDLQSVYRQWAAEGASFHYVSSSPWPLFEPLNEFCQGAGFPRGSYHLRLLRLRDHMLRRLPVIRRRGKDGKIKSILKAFPGRQFILVGDSAERDPEIYGAAARLYPNQVTAIYIRQVNQRPLDAQRAEQAFRGLPRQLWSTFEAAHELPATLLARETAGAL
ncbi:MAG: App1 family protein [Pirellulaceae bacterium]